MTLPSFCSLCVIRVKEQANTVDPEIACFYICVCFKFARENCALHAAIIEFNAHYGAGLVASYSRYLGKIFSVISFCEL